MSTISQRMIAAIEDAMERGITQGEDIEYDVSMVAMPGPQNQPQPFLGLSFTIPAVALGQGHSVMFLLPPSIPPQDEVDEILRRVIAGLVETRSAFAAQEMAAANGHKDLPPHVSPSGLILPGQ